MVSRKVIEKLSDDELEKYIKPESRFVPESIQYAYDILKERGRKFTEIESEEINNLIESKKASEIKSEPIKNNGWDKNITENESAIKLYTYKLIWIFSVLFGVIFGTFLQIFNYFKTKNYKALIVTLIFGVLYTTLQIFITDKYENIEFGRSSLRFILSGIGALGLHIIRENIFKTEIEYRAKSFILPLIICIVIYIPIIYAIVTTH
jgi:VIT1/CCC1 family predicted Fe2+/Mn2+ transporter